MVLLGGMVSMGCRQSKPEPPTTLQPAAADAPAKPPVDIETEWTRFQREITLDNHEQWFEETKLDPDIVSALLVELLNERVGACFEWIAETCEDHHFADAPTEPDPGAGVDDECAAQQIFLAHVDRLIEEDRRRHASSIASLPEVDQAQAERLLDVAIDLAPFASAVEDYAMLTTHTRGLEGDEALIAAATRLLEAQPPELRAQAMVVLATQRLDPLASMNAAYALAEAGDDQYLPVWREDTSLRDIAFELQMFSGLEVPPTFVSKKGLTTRRVVHEEWGSMQTFEPPKVTASTIPWSASGTFESPWQAEHHEHPTATMTRCDEAAPSCEIAIHGAPMARESGIVTRVGFERTAKGGFKVREVETVVWAPGCEL